MPLQALSVAHSDQFKVEGTSLFADAASTSLAIFGDFMAPVSHKSDANPSDPYSSGNIYTSADNQSKSNQS